MKEAPTQGRILVVKTGVIFGRWLHHRHAQRRKATNRHFHKYTLAC